jgi:hypothetical protein
MSDTDQLPVGIRWMDVNATLGNSSAEEGSQVSDIVLMGRARAWTVNRDEESTEEEVEEPCARATCTAPVIMEKTSPEKAAQVTALVALVLQEARDGAFKDCPRPPRRSRLRPRKQPVAPAPAAKTPERTSEDETLELPLDAMLFQWRPPKSPYRFQLKSNMPSSTVKASQPASNANQAG